MAATIAGRVITLNASGEKTSDIFPNGLKVSAIVLVAGATPTATTITANGLPMYIATPAASSSEQIGPSGAPVWYDDILATALGTNVVCYVHFL